MQYSINSIHVFENMLAWKGLVEGGGGVEGGVEGGGITKDMVQNAVHTYVDSNKDHFGVWQYLSRTWVWLQSAGWPVLQTCSTRADVLVFLSLTQMCVSISLDVHGWIEKQILTWP